MTVKQALRLLGEFHPDDEVRLVFHAPDQSYNVPLHSVIGGFSASPTVIGWADAARHRWADTPSHPTTTEGSP